MCLHTTTLWQKEQKALRTAVAWWCVLYSSITIQVVFRVFCSGRHELYKLKRHVKTAQRVRYVQGTSEGETTLCKCLEG